VTSPGGLQLGADAEQGERMHALASRLFPICRSITGDGLRETLAILGEELPLEITEIPTGTPILDWSVPQEWNVRDAWIAAPDGRRVVDLADSSLHVLNYSTPVRARMPLSELRPHLHTLPDRPGAIPYRTSYWQPRWGFCLAEAVLAALPDGEYEVRIDSTLEDGHMTYAEAVIPGSSQDEVLISTHACHPSLANDNLSGIVVAHALARRLAAAAPLRYTYRFLWSPGTIGPIAWLARNDRVIPRVRAGLVLAAVGDPASITYKRSRRGDTITDRAAIVALRDRGAPHAVVDWSPYGGDERQFCSPGYDLAMGTLTRTPLGEFPENHTSDDDLDFVRPEALADSFAASLAIVDVLEGDRTLVNLSPRGEPQLGRRGLFGTTGGAGAGRERELALLWVLSLGDGEHSLIDIAGRSGVPFGRLRAAAEALEEVGLVGPPGAPPEPSGRGAEPPADTSEHRERSPRTR